MEENVALDSSKQKKFDKSIKGIKKLLKKTGVAESKSRNNINENVKSGRIVKKKRKERGLVYLAHIPHGFYEHEMTEYFKQFGVVTNARVIKSKRTGRSKGFAFVEFKEPAVGQIVAETMNNYLMGKRLIKASYIPPEKQKRKALRKHWNSVNNPGNNLRIKMKKAHNAKKDEKGELQRARKLLKNITNTKKRLAELGINYEFFSPVDVPEALQQKVEVNQDEGNKDNEVTNKKSRNKEMFHEDIKKDIPIWASSHVEKKMSKSMTGDVSKNIKSKENNTNKTSKQEKPTLHNKEKTKNDSANNSQKQKKKKIRGHVVVPPEDFIKIQQDSENETASSDDFDSDEFEKTCQLDSDGSDVDDSEGSNSEEVDSEIEMVSSDESEKQKPQHKATKKTSVTLAKQVSQKQQHQNWAKKRAPLKQVAANASKKKKK